MANKAYFNCWLNNRADGFLIPRVAASLGDEKLWIQTSTISWDLQKKGSLSTRPNRNHKFAVNPLKWLNSVLSPSGNALQLRIRPNSIGLSFPFRIRCQGQEVFFIYARASISVAIVQARSALHFIIVSRDRRRPTQKSNGVTYLTGLTGETNIHGISLILLAVET